MLESEYQQLRDLSAGRMLDLDSLIAFIRAAQLELIWIHEREDLEVTRNWSDINQLDLPMLQNYYKQVCYIFTHKFFVFQLFICISEKGAAPQMINDFIHFFGGLQIRHLSRNKNTEKPVI